MKKKYQIKNRYINKIIVEMEAENFKEVVTKNKANLQGANLQGANLQGADLQGANLQGANLRGVDLQEADLQGADLRGANLWRAKIKITQKEDLIKCLGVTIEA